MRIKTKAPSITESAVRKLFLCFFLLWFQPVDAAKLSSSCVAALEAANIEIVPVPPALDHNGIGSRESEYERIGTVLNGRKGFPKKLKDDTYVFLVVNTPQGECVIYNPRATVTPENLSDTKYLAGHPGLLAQARAMMGEPVTVIAGGEFQIHNGEVSQINNRMGRFDGADQRHLDYGVMALAARRLPVRLNTLRENYKGRPAYKVGDPHIEAEEMAARRKVILLNREQKAMLEKLKKLNRDFYEAYPEFRHPRRPGYIDTENVFRDNLQAHSIMWAIQVEPEYAATTTAADGRFEPLIEDMKDAVKKRGLPWRLKGSYK